MQNNLKRLIIHSAVFVIDAWLWDQCPQPGKPAYQPPLHARGGKPLACHSVLSHCISSKLMVSYHEIPAALLTSCPIATRPPRSLQLGPAELTLHSAPGQGAAPKAREKNPTGPCPAHRGRSTGSPPPFSPLCGLLPRPCLDLQLDKVPERSAVPRHFL